MKKMFDYKSISTGIAAIIFSVGCMLLMCSAVSAAEAAILLFSDLTWGPKTGWEGSTTKGAAVTIWGKNLGSPSASSKITVNGTDIISTDSTYIAEWGALGPARNLERITFWLNSSCADGAGTITVTVNGVPSNTLPFTVMAGKIYFIAVSDGNNSYNGRYSTRTGHSGSDGPFKDIDMFNPSYNPSGVSESYLCYVKGGTYTKTDRINSPYAFVALRGPYGSSANRHALVGYPAETATLNTAGTAGIIWNADYSPYGYNQYFTYAKLNGVNGKTAIDLLGDYTRIIGCHFKDYLDTAWSGVVWVTASKHVDIFGNFFDHLGYDSYKHNIYIKTQAGLSGDRSTQDISVGWNEFNNPVADAEVNPRGGAIFLSRNSDMAAYPTQNIFIHENYFHDGSTEFIYIGDNVAIGDVYIYNNIFKGGTNTNGGAISFAGGTNNVYLYNNVFYQTGNGAGALLSGFDTGGPLNSRVYSKNNIYYANGSVQYLFWDGASKGAQFHSDHDLYYPGGGSAIVPSGSGITVTNPLAGDPLFTIPGTDFHLQAGSPAIDTGASDVSAIVTTDFDGYPRPAGSAYDIGVYESGIGYSLGGSISGLRGTVTLLNNGTISLPLYNRSGQFMFPTGYPDDYAYSITVGTHPPGQTCTVVNGSGTISGSNITNTNVTCTDTPGIKIPTAPTGLSAL